MSSIRSTIRAWWDRVCPLLPGEPSQLDRAIESRPALGEIVVAEVRPTEWVAAQGDHMLGRVKGDHWFGFWAQPLDSRRSPVRYETLEAAAEYLSLEFALHYGETVRA